MSDVVKKPNRIATFIGHRDIHITMEEHKVIRDVLIDKIEHGITIFWCGANGNFDSTCTSILKELKSTYKIQVYVVTPYFDEHYLKELKTLVEQGVFDGIISPPIEAVPPKYAILARNRYMVDNSTILFAYVDRKFGGAYSCYKYAQGKGVSIINFGSLGCNEILNC